MNFILAHLNSIILGIWGIFFGIVLVRFIRPQWVKNISYRWLIALAVALHIFYVIFVAWGQYHIWATSSDFTRFLLSAPLPTEAPLPTIFEWARPYFSHSLGYFFYYVFGRFFLSTIVLFTVTGFFYAILKFWYSRQNNFRADDPEIFCILMLISGWPGIVALVPLGFVIAILSSLGALIFFKRNQAPLAPAFLVVTPIALIFAKPILDLLHLYSLLKL
ncbi:MAG: hypothetical protein HY228_00900 [Candidatus Yonathbacteria bacterium]|nr:hypothetical protein [Candidatus Yonathbacteria bacterium]